jgi:hypothetical protein
LLETSKEIFRFSSQYNSLYDEQAFVNVAAVSR